MTTKLKVTDFIVIEKALSNLVLTTISDYLQDSYELIFTKVEDGLYADAIDIALNFNFVPSFTAKKTALWFYSLASLKFGASNITKDINKVALPKYVLENTMPTVVSNLINTLSKKASNDTLQMVYALIEDDKAYKATITKAERAERITRDFQSFKDGASQNGMLVSQLHTSRLSAFGFTSQAEVSDITRYALNEQLDNRICPVCRIMHKKEFDVASARSSLDIILYVQDADEIKALQTWPKQTKAGIQELKSLTPEELVSRNLHIPPFHPSCRGLLYPVGDVPDLPPQEVYDYTATPDDFTGVGLDATAEDVSNWNNLVTTHPADVIGAVTNNDPLDLVAKVLDGEDIFASSGLDYLVIDADFIKVGATGKYGGDSLSSLELLIGKNNQATITRLDVDNSTAFSTILSSLLNNAENIGVNSLSSIVNAKTSYAFAQLGFVPSAVDWGVMTGVINNRITSIAADLPKELYIYLLGLAASTNPTTISTIAELTYAVNGVPLSKYLLDGFYWTGTLDTTNVVNKTKALKLLNG